MKQKFFLPLFVAIGVLFSSGYAEINRDIALHSKAEGIDIPMGPFIRLAACRL
jgi:hypothetical protein